MKLELSVRATDLKVSLSNYESAVLVVFVPRPLSLWSSLRVTYEITFSQILRIVD